MVLISFFLNGKLKIKKFEFDFTFERFSDFFDSTNLVYILLYNNSYNTFI